MKSRLGKGDASFKENHRDVHPIDIASIFDAVDSFLQKRFALGCCPAQQSASIRLEEHYGFG